MRELPKGHIMTVPCPTGECKRCGAKLPIDIGQEFEDCEQWGEQTLEKIPRPHDLRLLLEIRNHGMLCRLCGLLQNEITLLMETFDTKDESGLHILAQKIGGLGSGLV